MAERDAQLVEYQKAQDSAEHHDGRVANVTNLWVGTAVLMGFVLNALTTKHAAHNLWWVLLPIASLGIGLTFMAWVWSERANALKRQKYDRCKQLEEILHMRQHTDVDAPSDWQDWAYRVLIVLFIGSWVAVLFDVLLKRF